MTKDISEIVKKMDALGLWGAIAGGNFALKPLGTVFPYFCTALCGELPGLKVRLMMIEGWQTFHDFLRGRADPFFGVASTPVELPHFELLIVQSGDFKLYRYDAGYMPREVEAREKPLLAKMLWEIYGYMMRIESDSQLPLRYAGEQAIFARIEKAKGKWQDEPLAIVQPQPYVEKIALEKAILSKVKDLPLKPDEAMAIDFHIVQNLSTNEPRPRCVYQLSLTDCATQKVLFCEQTSVLPAVGLKGMWEAMPTQVLNDLAQLGRVPGQFRCRSPRVFRFLRPICLELPIRLSLHDKID